MARRIDLEKRVREAVRFFWRTRKGQSTAGKAGDQGERSAATGGAQMDGFVNLAHDLLLETGVPSDAIFRKKKIELPGFFRPEKQWDLLVVCQGHLLAGVEMKSHIGPSFGNNYNNRTEEALGNATDLWTAYREGAFQISKWPWLGYLMLLEDTERSQKPVKNREPHFRVFEEFCGASYARRYELLLTRLLRERLYDGGALLLSERGRGLKQGAYREPLQELSFGLFVQNMIAAVLGHLKQLDF